MTSTAAHLPADYAAAAIARQDDDFVDAPGPTVHLPAAITDKLLELRGWRILPARGGTEFVRPDGRSRADGGKFGVDFLWERDDALGLALCAEALA